MTETLAIIGSGYMAKNIAITARKKGIATVCFSNDTASVAADHVDEFVLLSIYEKDEIVSACKKRRVSGVISTTEITIAIAAYVSEQLHLNGNSYTDMLKVTDKSYVRKATENTAEISKPNYIICEKTDEPPVDVRFPVIVKPTQLGGKRGITVAYDREQLLHAFEYARQAISQRDQRIIVEEFLSGGREYSVEALSYCGKHYIVQVTEKISSGPPHCVELGHMQPAEIDDDMRKKVIDAVSAVLTAINYNNGASHTEIKIINGKVYLIEVNCRPGGDHIAYPLTDLSTGISYLGGAIDIALSHFNGLDPNGRKNGYAGVMFVTKQTEYLKHLLDTCDDKPWLYKVNRISEELKDIDHNDGNNTDYIIYYSKDGKPEELFRCIDEGKHEIPQ